MIKKNKIQISKKRDPYLLPSFSIINRIMRLIWRITYNLTCRFTPIPLHSWRKIVLRCFGAKLGYGVHIYPTVKIWAPWNLICEDLVGIGNGATIYNTKPLLIKSRAVISQEAYLCDATHDYNDKDFPLISKPIEIGKMAWICAKATVSPGIKVGDGAVLGLGSIATKDLENWSVYVGIPARKIKERKKYDYTQDYKSI